MKQVLSIALCLFLSQNLLSQITVDQPPEILDIIDECIITDPQSHPLVLDYFQNSAYGVASSACGTVTTPWTIVTADWMDYGCGEWYCDIEWAINDDCGSPTITEYSSIFIIDNEPPYFSQYPSDISINCSDPNAQVILDDWIANLGGGVLELACSGWDLDTLVLFDPDYVTCPYDGTMMVTFEVYTCGNPGDIGDATVHFTSSIIEFNDPIVSFSEGANNLEFCLVSNYELYNDVDVSLSLLNSSTASDGADFGPLVTNYTIPAGPAGSTCFTISLIDDNIIEVTEQVNLQITNLSSSSNVEVIGGQDVIEIHILDNDDIDTDSVENTVDNCPNDYNPFQEDIDNDGTGDVCDSLNTVSQVTEIQDNLYLNKIYSGVILKDQSDKCWMITVQEDGGLKTTLVECPD